MDGSRTDQMIAQQAARRQKRQQTHSAAATSTSSATAQSQARPTLLPELRLQPQDDQRIAHHLANTMGRVSPSMGLEPSGLSTVGSHGSHSDVDRVFNPVNTTNWTSASGFLASNGVNGQLYDNNGQFSSIC